MLLSYLLGVDCMGAGYPSFAYADDERILVVHHNHARTVQRPFQPRYSTPIQRLVGRRATDAWLLRGAVDERLPGVLGAPVEDIPRSVDVDQRAVWIFVVLCSAAPLYGGMQPFRPLATRASRGRDVR